MKKYFILLPFLITSYLFAQVGKYNPDYKWFTIKGEHVEVHFHEGTERTAKIVLKIAEEVWKPITTLYGYEPDKVHFIIKDIDDYSNGATYFFDNKIEIWASALDFDLRGSHNWLRNVITHEFTHMVNLQTAMKMGPRVPAVYLQYLHYQDERRPDILYGYPNSIISYPLAGINVPSWLAEGTAQYQRYELGYDYWDSHRDMILRSYVLDNDMLTWNQMGVFGKTSLGNESVYNSGFALTTYIAKKYGEDKLKEIFSALKTKTNFTIDAAVEDVLGISGIDLYQEWKNYLTKDYNYRIQNVKQNLVVGDTLVNKGFGNFFPFFSKNDSSIIYISNKGKDYLSQTSVYIYNFKTKKEKLILPHIFSSVSFIPGTQKIIYAKLSDDNPKWTNIHDIFVYDITKEEETRLTHGLRANYPSVSTDGKKIVFLYQKDGTTNLGTVNIDGKDFRRLTFFENGEQVFNPRFSPDNKTVYFGFIKRDDRDIAKVDTNGANFGIVIHTRFDERNPIFGEDGNFYYASDKDGISNIYKYDFNTKTSTQITNVTGGAFYPDADKEGNIVYSGYTSHGYKLFYLPVNNRKQIGENSHYLSKSPYTILRPIPLGDLDSAEIKNLRNYDDKKIPDYEIKKYTGEFTKLTFLPYLRYDDYNTTSNSLEKLKVGAYVSSSDYLDRFDIFAGGGINARMERDLFLMFNYRDKIPGIYNLGLKPELSFELYNISRKANTDIFFGVDSTQAFNADYTVPIDVTYSLLEFDASARHRLFSRNTNLELRYIFSRYSATIGSFVFPNTTYLYPTTSDTYLIGHQFTVTFSHTNWVSNKNSSINKIGRSINLKLEYEYNRYNNEGKYKVEGGTLQPVYGHYNFPRLELNWRENFALFNSHALDFRLRYGTIFGPPQPDFFNFYLGGLPGMKGYPFYSLSGNELIWLNATYRFPIASDIDARFGPWYLDKVYFSFYGDYGNTWNVGYPKLDDFKKDLGAELRVKLISFYIFPTAVFVNGSYSLDKFETEIRGHKISTGKEWRFYFGVLFDFDL